MKRLYEADKVAYVRFASVYKDFTDPESFATEVAKFSSMESPEKTDDQWGAAETADDKEGNEQER